MKNNKRNGKGRLRRSLPCFLVLCAAAALVLGTFGFCRYYIGQGLSCCQRMPLSLYNAARLFSMNIDTEFSNPAIVGDSVFWMLLFARILAFFPIAGTVFAIFKALLPKLFSLLEYFIWRRRANRLLLIGGNAENIRLYQSECGALHALILSESGGDVAALRAQNVRYHAPENDAPEDVLAEQLKAVLDDEAKTLRVIINTNDDALNLRLSRRAADCIRDSVKEDMDAVRSREKEIKKETGSDKETQKERIRTDATLRKRRRAIVEKLERVSVYAFGEREHEQVYRMLEDRAVGALHGTSRHHLASFEFLTEHPMTEFLTVGDEPNGGVDKDVEFNMLFIGFGNTNREIFLDAFSTVAFIECETDEIPRLKSVNYHIFDRHENADHDRLLNHTVYRFLEDFQDELETGERKEADYLDTRDKFPTPSAPRFHPVDADDKSFYDEVRKVCAKNPKSINYLLIADGDDFSNIDLARRMVEKKNEWALPNLYIFAKVRDGRNETAALSEDDKAFFTYGSESFTLDDVIHNKIEAMAYHRKRVTLNIVPTETDQPNHLTDDTVWALYSWYAMDYDRRRSSLYNLLGLRMKLQLLGLDYEPFSKEEKQEKYLTEDDYFKRYAKGCAMEKNVQPEKYRGARYSYETRMEKADFRKNLPRMNLAVQEHYRWNGYMIARGYIPATRAQIEGKDKSYADARYHANLGSFEALLAYRDLPGKDDVIPYDFKLLDEAYFFLNEPDAATGREYRIVRREPPAAQE